MAAVNAIHSASAIELAAHGYVEEEFFIEGTANNYRADAQNPMADAVIESEGHRYKTRLVVRRPQAEDSFNGVVVVEWMNVTGGVDKDIDWWQSGEHLVANGYAYVFVSAQQMGIDTMKQWSDARYGSLDVTHDDNTTRDELSYDIFSAVGKAIHRVGESSANGEVDILDGLKAEQDHRHRSFSVGKPPRDLPQQRTSFRPSLRRRDGAWRRRPDKR